MLERMEERFSQALELTRARFDGCVLALSEPYFDAIVRPGQARDNSTRSSRGMPHGVNLRPSPPRTDGLLGALSDIWATYG